MNTIRDIVESSLYASKVLGANMPITGARMNRGVDILNMILLEEFVAGLPSVKEIINHTFTGARTYTIGTANRTIDGVVTSPDILVSVMPDSIDRIVQLSGDIRYSAYPITSGQYYGRGNDVTTSEYPTEFYYNRQGFGDNFATINFIGNPSHPAEIVVTSTSDIVVQSTSLSIVPKAIIPYLTHELSFRYADENGIDAIRQKMQANKAYKLYQMSSDDTDIGRSDESFSTNVSPFGSADAIKSQRQIMSGEI